jgi:hypothetical protein
MSDPAIDLLVAHGYKYNAEAQCWSKEENMNAYLGDGVYASFDGFQIWLAVNHHENKQVAIEPKVMESLLAYAEKVWGKRK